MSALDALLNPVYSEQTVSVTVGDRFIDPETGKPAVFKLRTLRQSERAEIRRRSRVTRDIDGHKDNVVDNDAFLARCIVEACVDPDLRSAKLSEKYKSFAPDEMLKDMFLVPEYERLAKAFLSLNLPDEEDTGEISKN